MQRKRFDFVRLLRDAAARDASGFAAHRVRLGARTLQWAGTALSLERGIAGKLKRERLKVDEA